MRLPLRNFASLDISPELKPVHGIEENRVKPLLPCEAAWLDVYFEAIEYDPGDREIFWEAHGILLQERPNIVSEIHFFAGSCPACGTLAACGTHAANQP